jgi:hypothetical protein
MAQSSGKNDIQYGRENSSNSYESHVTHEPDDAFDEEVNPSKDSRNAKEAFLSKPADNIIKSFGLGNQD